MSTFPSVDAALARVPDVVVSPFVVLDEALQAFPDYEARLQRLLADWQTVAAENPDDIILCPLGDILQDVATAILVEGEGASYERAA